jgi:cytosine permease
MAAAATATTAPTAAAAPARIGWFGLATIWFGGVISVPALLVGATLIAGLGFGPALLWGGLGFVIVGSSMALLGARAAERDADTQALAAAAFGPAGARLVLGLVVGLPLIGWFGVQTAIAAGSLVRIVEISFGLRWPLPVVALLLGATMTLTAVAGFGALKWLNYLAVPAKVALVAYGVAMALRAQGLGPALAWQPDPAKALDPLTAIGMAVGFVAVAAVIAPDYARQARSARDAVWGCLLGLVPAATLLAACGALLAIAQQTHDIVEIYARLGLPLLALTVLIVATWTTNVMNVYSAGLALGGLFGWTPARRWLATALAGLAGSGLAAAGILERLTGFLSLLTLTVMPIAGVMIAAWWLTPRATNVRAWRWQGLLAWALGVAAVLWLQHPLRNLLGPVIAAAAMVVLVTPRRRR